MGDATAQTISKRGRPRDWAKRSAIVEAARTRFLHSGLDAVTIEGVAQAAGVSKVTVYSHFQDKSALFEAVIEEERQRLHRNRIAIPTEPGNLRHTLEQFGIQFVRFVTLPETVAVNRVLTAQLHKYPQLARSFFDSGAGQLRRDLARLLSSAADAGQLNLVNGESPSDHLISMLAGLGLVEQRYGLTPPPKKAEIESHVTECVGMFLRAYSPDDA